MVCEAAGIYHEEPSQRLAQMAALIAVARGSPIDTFGSTDLLLRDEHGARRRIMEADQTVYLHAGRDRPDGPAIVVGEDALPDVVVEVDHTTDVRRRKLAMYQSWKLPEVWVEVPDVRAPSRAANRGPGLTIHVLQPDGRYRPAPESRAFPGWTAAEIHRAMNEPVLSAESMSVLERVGRVLRDRDGAVRVHYGGARAEGRAEARRRTGGSARRRRGTRRRRARKCAEKGAAAAPMGARAVPHAGTAGTAGGGPAEIDDRPPRRGAAGDRRCARRRVLDGARACAAAAAIG